MSEIQDYITQQKKEIIEMQKEIDILEATGLDLIMCKNGYGIKEFSLEDYSLANRVKLEKYSTYGIVYQLIQFIYDVKTEKGDISIYCRHKGWPTDKKRFAYKADPINPNNCIKKPDIGELLNFYEQQNIKPKLLQSLKEQIQIFYKQKEIKEELDELKV